MAVSTLVWSSGTTDNQNINTHADVISVGAAITLRIESTGGVSRARTAGSNPGTEYIYTAWDPSGREFDVETTVSVTADTVWSPYVGVRFSETADNGYSVVWNGTTELWEIRWHSPTTGPAQTVLASAAGDGPGTAQRSIRVEVREGATGGTSIEVFVDGTSKVSVSDDSNVTTRGSTEDRVWFWSVSGTTSVDNWIGDVTVQDVAALFFPFFLKLVKTYLRM